MSRANTLAFVQALAIIFGLLSLVGAIEQYDENARIEMARQARAERAQEARSVRAAEADEALGIVRLMGG